MKFPENILQLEASIERCAKDDYRNKILLYCIAIDVLSNLYYGKLSTENYAKRYRQFVVKFGQVTSSESEIVYQLRSALIHFYGDFAFNPKSGNQYRFVFKSEGALIEKKGTSLYEVGCNAMEAFYNRVKSNYITYVETFDIGKEKFQQMKKHFGESPKNNSI